MKDLHGLHCALIANYRFRSDMINGERVFSILTNYNTTAKNIGVLRQSCIARKKKNSTHITAEEFSELWPAVKEVLKPGSTYRALFADPDWAAAWAMKYPNAKKGISL